MDLLSPGQRIVLVTCWRLCGLSAVAVVTAAFLFSLAIDLVMELSDHCLAIMLRKLSYNQTICFMYYLLCAGLSLSGHAHLLFMACGCVTYGSCFTPRTT